MVHWTTFTHPLIHFLGFFFPSTMQTEQLVTLWILFIVTIAGNSIVLLSTWKRKRKSRMTFFVTQLALTDCFTGFINILTDIIWRFTGDFLAPDIVCRVVRYLQVQKPFNICYPLLLLQTQIKAKVLYPNHQTNLQRLLQDKIILFPSSLPNCSVIYFIVIRTIWMKSKAHAVIISNCSDGKFCASYNHRGLISKAKVKAIKYSIVIVLAFVLCWSPYFLFDILDNFSVLPETKERFYASVIIQNLPSLNSAVNPLIYCVFSNSLCHPFGRTRNLGGTFRDGTDGQEMQVLSKPEYI
uniref:Neuropeptide S receptor 1 n=1 Tax=Pelusios castaneus TaxID=367368 RepID=A0A8C8VQK1_9SAUR